MQSRFRFLTHPNFLVPTVALLLRLIYLLHIQSSPYFNSPELDSKMHDLWAQQIVAGDFASHEPFFRAPLYYYFLALIYYLFGHNYLVPRLLQICLGAFAAWLTYRLGRRIYGENAGIIAGFIYACCGPLIYFDAELRIPAVLLPLILLTLLQLDRQRENPSTKGFLLAGALLGLTALARPNIMIILPFVWIWILLILRGKWQFALSITLGTVLLIAPVTLRNYIVGDDVVLVGSQAGVNYYIGNNPQSDGYTAIVPGTPGDWEGGYRETIRIAEEATGKELKPSQVSRYWFNRAFLEMSEDIPRWISLTWHKSRLLFSGHEIGNNDDIYFNRRFSWLLGFLMWEKGLAFPFGLLMPFGLFSLLLIFNWKRDSLSLLFFASYAAGIIAFFVCTRFRLPLIPILAIWSGAGALCLMQIIKKKNLRKYIPQLIIFAALLVTLNLNPLAGAGTENFEGAYYLGGKYLEKGKVEQALAAYQEAVRLDPASARARNGLAMTLLRHGER
ncbi:glycosyltransferase family 39 protein, partial [bacterium]|nr:glycosyltransferase family 39 protein [bacterium]